MQSPYEVNKIYQDEFGRKSGILLVDKPKDFTSHDIVNIVRRELDIKKVGHAGALDPFATGLLVILVGKATPLSDSFLGLDKEYEAEILFGVSTDTGDPTGEIKNYKLKIKRNDQISKEEILNALKSFQPEYKQYVPVFSSVKVKGEKLRKLARKYDEFEIVDVEGGKTVKFYKSEKEEMRLITSVTLPSKIVKIYSIDLFAVKELKGPGVQELFSCNEKLDIRSKMLDTTGSHNSEHITQNIQQVKIPEGTYFFAKIRVSCSKGTYIRQLAVDIGKKLGMPAMLVNLRRTRIGEYDLDNVYPLALDHRLQTSDLS